LLPTGKALTESNPLLSFDVCVYGGTASGVIAAIAAAREGCRVVIIEPSRWLGGMTGGGLSNIDWGRQEAVGGTTKKTLKDGVTDPQYRQLFKNLVRDNDVRVIYEHRLGKVTKQNGSIHALLLDYAPPDRFGCPIPKAKSPGDLTLIADVFIDCSYEGDLMAKSGVSYTFGRESADTYGESLGGVPPYMEVYDIDPYLKPGDSSTGLIPLLQDRKLGPGGSADNLTMGYGFRWKFSNKADRLPIAPPEHYDPTTFELYRRGFQNHVNMSVGRRMRKLGEYSPCAGHIYALGSGNLARALWAPTDYGSNTDYPDGDWPTRSHIWKSEQDFMRGITHFLQTDPSVPDALKKEALNIGFQPGIFDETGGWPNQLYIRESRRMKSAYILTQKDVEGKTNPQDPVGLASYGVDDWPYATVPLNGKVALNGGMFSMLYLNQEHNGIYKIPFRSITPLKEECHNLLVPVCCSASHIAMTSLRMEPVWMIIGESAGVAASMAVKNHVPVQDLDYPQLREKLVLLGQKLDPPTVQTNHLSGP